MTVQEVQNDNLVHTVETTGKSTVVNEAVVVDTLEQRSTIGTDQQRIRSETQARVDALPKVPVLADPKNQAAAEVARERAVSSARIDGLWESFCKAAPTDVDCVAADAPTTAKGE